MDMSSITAAIGSLKTASDIAKAMKDINDASLVQGKTIELQSEILSAQSSAIAAQSEQFSLLERIRNLEAEVTRMETWNAEKDRYKLHQVRDGLFTYILKDEEEAAEPSHQLCANCFNTQNKKSILQRETQAVGRAQTLVCLNCDSEIYLTGMRRKEHDQRRTRRT